MHMYEESRLLAANYFLSKDVKVPQRWSAIEKTRLKATLFA